VGSLSWGAREGELLYEEGTNREACAQAAAATGKKGKRRKAEGLVAHKKLNTMERRTWVEGGKWAKRKPWKAS